MPISHGGVLLTRTADFVSFFVSVFTGGGLLWQDSSVVEYSNWEQQDANLNMLSANSCFWVQSNTGLWKPGSCKNRTHGVICKRPRGGRHKITSTHFTNRDTQSHHNHFGIYRLLKNTLKWISDVFNRLIFITLTVGGAFIVLQKSYTRLLFSNVSSYSFYYICNLTKLLYRSCCFYL